MSHFKPGQMSIKEEDGKGSAIRVVKLETGGAPQVKDFAFNHLKQAGKGDYNVIKAKYGSLAATDEERRGRSTRDSHFSINPLLRDPLAVEHEELRVIEARVTEQVESIREDASTKGTAQGYEAGLKKGYDEAFSKFQEEGASRIQSLEGFIKEFEGLKKDMHKANEHFLMEMTFRIAKMVMLKELSTDKDYLLRLSHELIERVGLKDNITVRVSLQDQQTIEMLKTELPKTMGELKNLQIETSDQIPSGGCTVETQWNAIDASIDTQLKGIYEALMGSGGQ
jgi:flagellar assembly protein FliH